ncbi:NAD(P)-dependent oxidoreductase [Puia dinghuensis]|uniref:3-beta hydroxysteroid dehydrogenase n=1 Tax=Puia dinghuensis TaxID=1792502 RepID=A0A8J2UCX5_9BACT|nr:NAD(P)-dependent oxidoreductase [Puia dinghuensis]GGA99630.1 3-beta hydroxysteroid dehydrogenase [Puia dinghuensis]
MKVAIIGATGFVGTALLNELTTRGHEVIAIARHPENIRIKSPLIHPVTADVLDPQQVAKAVKGADAVVSAYNPGWTNPRIYEEFLEGSRAIQAGVRQSGVKRLIVIGGAGSLEIKPGFQLIDTPQFPAEYKPGASGARDYLNEIKKEKDLEWTFFSPAILMNHDHSGVRRGHYRLGLDNPVFDAEGKSVLSVEDLALVIVDELEHPKHIRQRFTAAY